MTTIMKEESQLNPTLSSTDKRYNFQRRSADLFEKEGFPTNKHENWLYWTPDTFQDAFITPQIGAETNTESNEGIEIDNGRIKSEGTYKEIIVSTDMAAYSDVHHITNRVETSSLSLLPNSFFEEFIILDIQQDHKDPIHVTIKAESHEKGSVNTRILCLVREGVTANVVVNHDCIQGSDTVTNTYFETVCFKESHLELNQVFKAKQNVNVFNSSIHMHEKASCTHVSYTDNAAIMRHDTEVNFHGEEADLKLKGLNILSGKEQFYNHLKVNHHVGNCNCFQHFKTILTDSSTSEFSGLVFVEKGAHGTDSTQLNQNLLFSDSARALSRPQLRIDADDVLCNHGSTVGQLNPEEIHYIKSRGLNEEAAKQLLIYGFAEEIIENIHDTLTRETLEKQVKQKIECMKND
ncbi:hypothetical protein DID78_02695 [Candidatus Marinamargulisbacteria bacterium SCGC AG-343-D04]|nr:hypothetical protein DID78_02695 [Candidatus Marinamargulisbacteria bacterium SCGC AG-343-D04]